MGNIFYPDFRDFLQALNNNQVKYLLAEVKTSTTLNIFPAPISFPVKYIQIPSFWYCMYMKIFVSLQ